MQAIIFADRLGSELSPLCNTLPPALLPLANRPVLEYTLDDIANNGISEVFIVSSHTRLLKAHFAAGEMWGLKLHYILSRGEESPRQIIHRNRSLLQAPFLALRGDILRSPCCKTILDRATKQAGHSATTRLLIRGKTAGISLVHYYPDELNEFDNLAWPLTTSEHNIASVEHEHGRLARLDHITSYYNASIETAEGTFELNTAAVKEIDTGLFVGAHCNVSAMSRETGTIFVGEHCRIDPQVRLQGPAIIGNHCYIESGVTINRSIILPNSYIGAGLQVDNTIICGPHLIRIDKNVSLEINDPAVIAYVDHEIDLVRSLPERLLGIALLVLSIPLWPLALLLSLLENPDRPVQKVTLLSNHIDTASIERKRKQIGVWKMSTKIPIFNKLAFIWLVVKGDLKLFGSSPILMNQTSMAEQISQLADWDLRMQQHRAGLLGPAQLDLPIDVPEEELRLNESYFIEQSGFPTLLQRVFKAMTLLLCTRTWWIQNPGHSVEKA